MAEQRTQRIPYLQIYWRVFKNYFKVTPAASIFSVFYYIVAGLFPAFTAIVLSSLFEEAYAIQQGENRVAQLLFWGLVYLAAYILNTVLNFSAGLVMELGADKRNVNYRYLLCEKLSRIALIDFEDSRIKDMKQCAEECLYSGRMNGIMRHSFHIIVQSFFNIISVSLVLARYSPLFLPLCIISVLPYIVARLIRGREFYQVKRKQSKKSRRLMYLWNLFTDKRTVKELRTLGADDYIFGKWIECHDNVQEELWIQNRKDALSLLLCDALRIIGYGACIALALDLTLRGTVSIGVFGACIATFQTLQSATRGMLVMGGELPRELAFASDYFAFIDLPEENSEGIIYPGLRDKFELRSIYFKYPNIDKYALENVSLQIYKGEKIAIVGENGSGKTTLIKLLLGLYPREGGEVLYDGVDVNSLDKASFYKTISLVSQNFVQYKLPLRENIAMSDTDSLGDDMKIKTTLRNAGLEELIGKTELDNELGTMFGGSDISGGQWQKLAIARGLFRDSKLIIMDEPTSALDPLIETEILTKFIELAKNKTAVIISHRVGLCRLVDKIVVMKEGRIAETGSHSELLAYGGEYARLFNAQEKWYRQTII